MFSKRSILVPITKTIHETVVLFVSEFAELCKHF